MKKLGCLGTLLMWIIFLPVVTMYYFIKSIR